MKLLDWIKGTFAKAPDGRTTAEPPARAPERIDSPAAEPATAPAPAQSEEGEATIETAFEEATIETPFEIAPDPRDEDPISIEPLPPIEVAPPPPPAAPPMHVNLGAAGIPDESEIERRRGMVRRFFNDYWSSVEEKPSTFAERLDGAEGYINERVAAGGEPWQLDHATRKQLGLPPSRRR